MRGTSQSTTGSFSGGGTVGAAEVHQHRVNALTFPPVTQEDLIQQTPKTVQFLLKDTKGFYCPKRMWQPVFGMTPASSYALLRFVSQETTLSELTAATGVIQDTIDSNYGFAVCNMTSLPLACAPYIKAIRSWEAVPSRGSPWGPFSTPTTPKDDVALVIAKTVSDLDPFAYPYEYNGLGVLFSKVIAVCSKIPKIIRTTTNVADAVAECVCDVQKSINAADQEENKRRGLFSKIFRM